jgi:hypothetical protein
MTTIVADPVRVTTGFSWETYATGSADAADQQI